MAHQFNERYGHIASLTDKEMTVSSVQLLSNLKRPIIDSEWTRKGVCRCPRCPMSPMSLNDGFKNRLSVFSEGCQCSIGQVGLPPTLDTDILTLMAPVCVPVLEHRIGNAVGLGMALLGQDK
jgi:hypothetical protein